MADGRLMAGQQRREIELRMAGLATDVAMAGPATDVATSPSEDEAASLGLVELSLKNRPT